MNTIPERFMYDQEYANFKPVTVFDYMTFREMCKNYEGLEKDLNLLHNHQMKVNKYRWGNTHFRFSNIFGDEFAFQIYGSTLHVWNAYGHVSLGHWDLSNNPNKAVNEILETSEHWTRGEVRCSDCGNWMNYQENNKQHYFAGVYCLSCWNGKWKAIEAKENYE